MAKKIFKYELGTEVQDTLSDYKGTIVWRTEYMFGCVRYGIQAKELFEGKTIDTHAFDEPQLKIIKQEKPKKTATRRTHGERPSPQSRNDSSITRN